MSKLTKFTQGVDFDEIKTLPDILRYHSDRNGKGIAQIFEGSVTTFAQFEDLTNKIANGLTQFGIGRGDRIAYVGKNSDSYFQIWFGATKIGSVLVSINWRLAAPEIDFIISDSQTKIVFVGPESVEAVKKAVGDKDIRVIEVEAGFANWRDNASENPPSVDILSTDTALQLYTSGTTGHPKGVLLSHKAVKAPWAPYEEMPWICWTREDVTLLAMPVGHIAGSGWGLMGLLHGACTIIMRDFDPERVLEHIQNDNVSRLFLVPSALQFVVDHPKASGTDFSKLTDVLYGASPIPVPLLRKSIGLISCRFIQLYGMTETSGGITYLPSEDHEEEGSDRMRSVGIPMPCAEIKIIDTDGNECLRGDIGEVAIRSESNMTEYWNRKEATKETISEDGWLRSGDAATMDDDGYVFLKDRVKDMIISGAENVYPAEVENVLCAHPAISQVAIIGVPDSKWGEAVKAIVVVEKAASVNEEDIIAFAKENLADFKVPKTVDFIAELPLNPSGKVLKRALRAPYWEGMDRQIN